MATHLIALFEMFCRVREKKLTWGLKALYYSHEPH